MEGRVAEHEAAVVKMRRRVKSLVDVTDKYSVANIFTRCRGYCWWNWCWCWCWWRWSWSWCWVLELVELVLVELVHLATSLGVMGELGLELRAGDRLSR